MYRKGGPSADDEELLRLFVHSGDEAWQIFLDRYGARVVGYLRALGHDRDQAMDRFVAVCAKLRANNYRRLREVQRLGRDGELLPWLFAVVRRVAIDQTVAEVGKRHLPRSIEDLDSLDHEVFRDYFWQGLKPSEICQEMARRHNEPPDPLMVFDALERILERLGSPRIWRLIAQRSRAELPSSLEVLGERGVAAHAESSLLQKERYGALKRLLDQLPARQRTLLRLRYGEGLGLEDLARQVGMETPLLKAELRRALRAARRLAAEEKEQTALTCASSLGRALP